MRVATWLEPEGAIIAPSDLIVPRARGVVELLSSVNQIPYTKLVECRWHSSSNNTQTETIVVEVEVERPQHVIHDIKRIERIALRFSATDNWYPEVLSLRSDFPNVPHLNLQKQEFPKSLCLYDQPWPDLLLRWTPISFLERIRFWLSETAKGTLHQTDQPLEPLLMGNGWKIVLPPDLFDEQKVGTHEQLSMFFASDAEDCHVLVTKREETSQGRGIKFIALSFIANSQTHGVIRHTPRNLHELHNFVSPVSISLLDTLREKFEAWNKPDFLDKKLILIIAFPLTRSDKESIEISDTWAFVTSNTIQEIGIEIGLWDKTPDDRLGRVLQRDENKNGTAISLEIISPVFDINRELAASSSGVKPELKQIFALGVGALGSQVVSLLARSGFGRWHLLDSDVLLPHNTVRHDLGRWAIGRPKSRGMALKLNQIYENENIAEWTCADILRPGKEEARIIEALQKTDVLLDLSAEISASRHLIHEVQTSARRIALFLNPRGSDLVLLAEDLERSTKLDCIEMQYYRAIYRNELLTEHLDVQTDRIRYARSCRDLSSKIPTELVTMHAGLGARAIRNVTTQNAATAQVWRLNPTTLEITNVHIQLSKSYQQRIGQWTLILDEQLLSTLSELRHSKLPLETGGVLIGSYDLLRKIVYVVDTIPSPPDSEEWPTLYIRGSQGLSQEVERLSRITSQQLEYVGEWHSHPKRTTCLPSEDDLKVFTWLTENMSEAGLPALMAIAGDNHIAWYLGEMLSTGGWEIESLNQ